ncbi:MAG: CHAT domain-containing protein [Chitinophagaceae bacterium]|nr:CHAT domain-containing protein [Chitinophagaceae bacterium]
MNRKFLALIISCIIISTSLNAQDGNEYLNKAMPFMNSNPDSARFYLDKAYTKFRYTGDLALAYKTKYYKGVSYWIQQSYQQAYDTLSTYKSLMDKVGFNDPDILSQFYNGLGFAARDLMRFNESEKYLIAGIKLAENNKNSNTLSKLQTNLGSLYKIRGDYTKAEQIYFKMLDAPENKEEDLLAIYKDFGDLYSRFLMQPEKAHPYIDKATVLTLKLYGEGSKDHIDMVMSKAAAFFYAKEYESAIKNWEEALKMAKKNNDIRTVSFNINNIGRAYQLLGDLPKAIELTKQSVALKENILGKQHASTLLSYNNLARLYTFNSQIEESNKLLNESIKIHRELFGNSHPEMARAYSFLGYNYSVSKKYAEGIAKVQEGYSTAARVIEVSKNKLAPPEVIPFNPIDYSSLAYTHALLLYDSIKINKKFNKVLADFTLSCFRKSDEALMNIKLGMLPGDAVNQSGTYLEIYKSATKIFEDFYSITGEQKYFDEYLYYADKQKGFNLLVATKEQERPEGLLPVEVAERENKFREELAKQITKVKSGAPTDSLFSLQMQYYTLLDEINNKYPAYNSWKFGTKPLTLSQLQPMLGKRVVLDYVMIDSLLFITLISADKNKIYKVKVSQEQIKQSINDFRLAVVNQQLTVADKIGHQLYIWLIRPAEEILQKLPAPFHVTIIPDGFLGNVPFEALVKNEMAKPIDRYLIKDYIFSVHYNLSLAFKDYSKKSGGDLLAFAPTYKGKSAGLLRSGLRELPYAQQEAATIASLFGGKVIEGESASAQNFKKLAENASAIHVASHILLNEFNPDQSSIIFTTPNQDSELDALAVYELYAMNLSADLVTLSGCNSGMGKIEQGEGVMSLARAFMFAGCQNIVMSLWQVSDESTSELMTYFYTNLKDGMPKDEALREAKLKFLTEADEVKSNPYYWSGFVYTGNQKPLAVANNVLWYYVFSAIGVMAILFLVWRMKSKAI